MSHPDARASDMTTALGDHHFPLGARAAGGAYVIGERLRGERARGVYRGIARWDFDQRRVLVTLTTRQRRPHAELFAELALVVDGVAPLRHIGPVEPLGPGGGRYDAMVEDEPVGEPLSALELPLAAGAVASLVVDLGAVLARVHADGDALRCLAPETVYVRRAAGGDLAVAGIAPRALRFAASAEPPSYVLGPLYDGTYQAPETLGAGSGGAPADVFALSALAALLATGRHPFDGEWAGPQGLAILAGRRRPWSGPEAWRAPLERGLERDPGRRPPLGDLIDAAQQIRSAPGPG